MPVIKATFYSQNSTACNSFSTTVVISPSAPTSNTKRTSVSRGLYRQKQVSFEFLLDAMYKRLET